VKTIQALYGGKVQGVGFRSSVHSLARGFEVSGQVRNLADGRVQVVASGEDREVEDFFSAIRDSHLAGHIETEELGPAREETFRGFRIVT
jgi:acylphosphatase